MRLTLGAQVLNSGLKFGLAFARCLAGGSKQNHGLYRCKMFEGRLACRGWWWPKWKNNELSPELGFNVSS
eukprot:2592751-Amphidinium_carterae.1